ncbi:MAG: helix-turn-helix transcriptional regulator [Firmicutes bacterium]|nr:helix-turn-helix transcriptional regulator [Bacillota bacterium]
MISYEPFWTTLKEKNQSTYTLISIHGISSSTVNRLRHNQPINTTTLDDLCRILECDVDQILRYIPEKK